MTETKEIAVCAKIKRVEISGGEAQKDTELDRLADFMEEKVDALRNGQGFQVEGWIVEEVEASGLDCIYDDPADEPPVDDYYIVPKKNTIAVALVDHWFGEFLNSMFGPEGAGDNDFEGVMCAPVI